MPYSNTSNKIFLGGGAGSGQANNPELFYPKGGNGGGIAIISANTLSGNNKSILSKGDSATICGLSGTGCHEGMGGGGGGGTMLLDINQIIVGVNCNVGGGHGGDMAVGGNGRLGPGGGGGGGLIWAKQSSLSNVSLNINGGTNGVAVSYANDPWGSTTGQIGLILYNLKMPIDTSAPKGPLDSVRFTTSPTSCNSYNFNGFAFPITSTISTWLWSFGDGTAANTQNTSHTYSTTGVNNVKLVVTNSTGCSDSISAIVQPSFATADAGNDTTICRNSTNVLLQGKTVGGISFVWHPGKLLNDSTLLQPTANINTDTKFYFSVKNALGCTSTDSVTLSILPLPTFSISPNTSICNKTTTNLLATGGSNYQWSPTIGLSNTSIPNPIASPSQSTTYFVLITEKKCQDTATLSTAITILPNPTVNASSANDVDCTLGQSQLIASGALQYVWTPSIGLNNPAVYNPIATPISTTIYTVVGKDINGCIDSSKVIIHVSQNGKSGYYMPNAFTPNGDGKNDCFGIKYWGQITALQFGIYDRYGKRVFYTENPADCWDGTFNGQQQKADNYVYYIKASTACGFVNKSDNVILIR